MIHLRDAILGIFEEILAQNDYAKDLYCTRRTRVQDALYPTDIIPFSGGLRINGMGQAIFVEADRSGGITHLTRCWNFMNQNHEESIPRITVFYVFLAPSENVITRQRPLWDFLVEKIQVDCKDRLQAYFATCIRLPNLNHQVNPHTDIFTPYRAQLEAQGILELFEKKVAEIRQASLCIIAPPMRNRTGNQGASQSLLEESP